MNVSPHPDLAERSVRHFIAHGVPLACPDKIPEELALKAGVFVSIKVAGALRGCIGSITPSKNNVAEEIIHYAVSAATKDPRFSPITGAELDSLSYSVDVLSPLEEVDGLAQLDAKVYGVVVKSGNKQGVLLPDLEGIDSAEEQLDICRMKGQIKDCVAEKIFRFTVKRYK